MLLSFKFRLNVHLEFKNTMQYFVQSFGIQKVDNENVIILHNISRINVIATENDGYIVSEQLYIKTSKDIDLHSKTRNIY